MNATNMPMKNIETNKPEFVKAVDIIGGYTDDDGLEVVITKNGKYSFITDMDEIGELLSSIRGFVRASDGVMVNLNRVVKVDKEEMRLYYPDGESVIVEPDRWEEVLATYNELKEEK